MRNWYNSLNYPALATWKRATEREKSCMLILVVDDEESLCDLLGEILSDQHQVLKAYDGLQALETALQRVPDLIITDVMMPRMSGSDLVRALRADSATQHIPIILMSAVSLASPSLAQEAVAFLAKPFDIDLVEKTVANVIK